MRRRRTIFLLVLVTGCADIFGLDDYTLGDASTGTDASDAGELPDVGIGADGCSGPDLACVPTVPTGWTLIAYDEAFRPSCAAHYATPTDVGEGIVAPPASCTCGCGVKPPTCSSVRITVGKNTTCDDQSIQTGNGTACTNLPVTFDPKAGDHVGATGIPSGGSCAPEAGASVPAVAFANQGRVCELAVAPGPCAGGICVPSPAPYLACVRKAGVATCPSGYSVEHVIGTAVTDTRGCSACTCGFDAGSCGGTLVIAQNGGCNQGPQSIPADGTCTTVPGGMYKSFQYTPGTPSATCTPSATTPTGDAGFTDTVTVCCTQ